MCWSVPEARWVGAAAPLEGVEVGVSSSNGNFCTLSRSDLMTRYLLRMHEKVLALGPTVLIDTNLTRTFASTDTASPRRCVVPVDLYHAHCCRCA